MATPGKYDFKSVAFGFQKDSPFLPLFNYNLNKMKERGSLKQIQVKYEPPPQICPDYSEKSLGVYAGRKKDLPGVESIMTTKGMSLLARGSKGNWELLSSILAVGKRIPKSFILVLGFRPLLSITFRTSCQ